MIGFLLKFLGFDTVTAREASELAERRGGGVLPDSHVDIPMPPIRPARVNAVVPERAGE